MWGLRYIYTIISECIHLRGSHTYHDFFQISQFQGRHGSRAAFSYSLTAVVPSPFGHIRICDYALSRHLGGLVGRAGNGSASAEVSREEARGHVPSAFW